jgi:hypothetical protein
MTRWRAVLKIHPAAEQFPLIGPEELRELGEDIKAKGQKYPITFWCPQEGYGYCGGSGHYVIDGPFLLLDGRNRLDAMELVGIPVVVSKYSKKDIDDIATGYSDKALDTFQKDNPAWTEQQIMDFVGPASAEKLQRCKDARKFDYKNIRYEILFEKITPEPEHRVPKGYDVGDPYAYVVSANIRRRHLTTAQKGELIEVLLKAKPERSDRATAKIAQVSDKTIGKVRERLEATAEIPQLEKRVGEDGRARGLIPPSAEMIAKLNESTRKVQEEKNMQGSQSRVAHRPINDPKPQPIALDTSGANAPVPEGLRNIKPEPPPTIDRVATRVAIAKAALDALSLDEKQILFAHWFTTLSQAQKNKVYEVLLDRTEDTAWLIDKLHD